MKRNLILDWASGSPHKKPNYIIRKTQKKHVGFRGIGRKFQNVSQTRNAAHPICRTRTLPEREKMEEAATAAEPPVPAAEKTSSYRYWVRDTTGDAAPLPAPRKLDATDLAVKTAPATLGSVWNQVSMLATRILPVC
jgi:hypothetical protein